MTVESKDVKVIKRDGTYAAVREIWDSNPDSLSGEKQETLKLLYSNLNSFITQVLGGLWHGASWNFIIWGGINGIGMIVEKIWRELNWHVRFALITLLTGGLCVADYVWNMPVWRLFAVWAAIIWVGTAVRYVYWLIMGERENGEWTKSLAKAWAIVQKLGSGYG